MIVKAHHSRLVDLQDSSLCNVHPYNVHNPAPTDEFNLRLLLYVIPNFHFYIKLNADV